MKQLKTKLIPILVTLCLMVFALPSFAKASKAPLEKRTKSELIAVFKANEVLHQSFFKYNGGMVENAAGAMIDAISKIKDKKISKLLNFSKIQLRNIKAKNERNINNQSYHLVSMALIYVTSKYDVGEEYSAYTCPMVKKKWIQNTKVIKKVHNPYAPMMPHCGEQEAKN